MVCCLMQEVASATAKTRQSGVIFPPEFAIMKTISVSHPFRSFGVALVVSGLQFLSVAFPWGSAQAREFREARNAFSWVNLQSDIAGVADRTDPNLVNPWGLVLNPGAGIFWVSDNGKGKSTLYAPDGTPASLVVTIPKAPGVTEDNSPPTGIVFNTENAFQISANGKQGSAVFLFAAEDGAISGWNPNVDRTNAIIAVNNSTSGAVYKGLALGSLNGSPTLYATDFHNAKVDVFDRNFTPVPTAVFSDPNLPTGFAPFGIANIDGLIYVTYALQKPPDNHDDQAGPGNGFVDVFNPDGTLAKRLITGGVLNSPWGLAHVPEDFGKFGHNVLLVGNFGDGGINAFDIRTGTFLDALRNRRGEPLDFNGLWALVFLGERLYFTAGIADESHGLFGFIDETDHKEH